MNSAIAVQEIVVDGIFAGVVVGEQLLLRGGLDADVAQTAVAMGLLAIEINTGESDGPFTTNRARGFARQAALWRERGKAIRPQ